MTSTKNKQMALIKEIKQRIETAWPGSKVTILDKIAVHEGHQERGSQVGIEVTYLGFDGRSQVDQNQMIYALFKEELKETIHEIALKTKAK